MTKIAIYGLSVETERYLPALKEKYEIIGLLDSFQTSGELYNYPIISLGKAVALGVEKIIVVARPGSCKAIAKKIGKSCKNNYIELVDIHGNDLLAEKKVVYNLSQLQGYKKIELLSEFYAADVVSFDFFDTLVIRNITSFTDMIYLLEAVFKGKGISISNFIDKRIGIEKILARTGVPNLEEIYSTLLEQENVSSFDAKMMADLEFELELQLLQPRKEMVEFIETAKSLGKQVFITSDTYYSIDQLKKLMYATGINGVDVVLASCEYGKGKADGLFDVLISKAGTRNILHIGDDILVDVESANKHGLKSFKIYSGTDFLESVGGLGIRVNEQSISDKVKLGMFVANLFNSPFQFEDEEKRISVKTAYDVAYLFFAPLLIGFVQWFGSQITAKKIKNIWFGARDGYLIQKLFALFYPELKSKYLLTSRIAAIRAGMEDSSDIEYVDSMKYSGTVEDNLKTRFGIMPKQNNGLSTGLLSYKDDILFNAEAKRNNYLKYINSIGLDDGKIAFFDFVAKGTTQMYLQKIAKKNILGLYFMQLEPDFMKDKNLQISPYYKESERESSVIFDKYYILETVLTSPQSSVEEFDVNGSPIFSAETRSVQDIDCVMKMQEAIIKYAEKYLTICPLLEIADNKLLNEDFLNILSNVKILDSDFLNLATEDPFFNRFTKVTDVI